MKSEGKINLSELAVPELKVQLLETEQKLFKLRLSNAMAPLKNGVQIRNIRRQRARILTWIKQKEVAQTTR